MFATMFRVMKQLINNPMTLLQHKLIKWLYMACLVIDSLIGLGMIVAGGGTGWQQSALFASGTDSFMDSISGYVLLHRHYGVGTPDMRQVIKQV